MLKKTLKTFYLGVVFSIGVAGGILFLAKAAGLTATSGSPLTASNWNSMISNFFWGSGTGGIYYNGKVGIGTSTPNKEIHIKTPSGSNAELDIQSGTQPHWAIYHDESSQDLKIRNGVNKVSISNGGVLNAIGGLCINGDCKTSWNQVGSSISNNYTGTCDSAHRGATGVISGYYKICNGSSWLNILALDNYFEGDGSSTNPYRIYGVSTSAISTLATNCNYYNLNSTTLNNGISRGSGSCGSKACLSDGVYLIDPDGSGGNNAFKVYCDMSNDGGGWTLVVGINSSDRNHINTAAVTETNLLTSSGKGKYSDTLINTIQSIGNNQLKLVCNTSATFSSCTFASTTNPSGNCLHNTNNVGFQGPSGGGYSGTFAEPSYGATSANGCYGGSSTSWSYNGTMRAK